MKAFSVTVPGSLDVAPSAPCTHPDIITTKDVEGNLVPDDIGTSVSEDEDHSVLLPHQPDCVFQSKVQGLSCVCGLGQPAQVLHCPGHRDKHTLSSLLTRKRVTGVCLQRKRRKPDKANVWSAPVIMEVINVRAHCLKSVMLFTLTPSCTTSCACAPLYWTTLTLESLPANWTETHSMVTSPFWLGSGHKLLSSSQRPTHTD